MASNKFNNYYGYINIIYISHRITLYNVEKGQKTYACHKTQTITPFLCSIFRGFTTKTYNYGKRKRFDIKKKD